VSAQQTAAAQGGGRDRGRPRRRRRRPGRGATRQFSRSRAAYGSSAPSNVDLLMDVPLQITVELGEPPSSSRTSWRSPRLESCSSTSWPESRGHSGERQARGRGEVVVITQSFGVRVTDIVSPPSAFQCVR